ncbi:MAG: UDP-glucose/GDP-mannose dehydrogenase family protein [Candidatus Hydrogenedens sp.]|jgi:UDPglucose 6-dehydrogenase|nr:UDP-glucose/GDP-mannose dehydrogenase family protein [Candidatus Hydrogenedens sp.]
MKITILGCGYQGLVTGTCFAENGHTVICVDNNADTIALLQEGKLPLHEPGLEELIVRNLEEERLSFTTDLPRALEGSLMVFLCVGSPSDKDGNVDLDNVLSTAEEIARIREGYQIIVNKSTCPPGTAKKIEVLWRSRNPGDVVVNPDFMKEGSAVDDFLRPDRIIVGCRDIRVQEMMRELYSPFLRTGKPFLAMSPESAEMAKYATNAMLAARISLMNQLADLCEAYDCDIADIREAVGMDSRIGPTFLFPGIGFGGSGLPRDVAVCARLAEEAGLEHDLISAITAVNQRRRQQFLQKILDYYGEEIREKRLALWGVSFKARTDDIRDAPSLDIIEGLCHAGAQVVVYDPVAGPKVAARYGEHIEMAQKYYGALDGADGLIILTEWNEFRRPDYARMGKLMREKVIFDGRNLYTPSVMKEQGFRYFSVGRKTV